MFDNFLDILLLIALETEELFHFHVLNFFTTEVAFKIRVTYLRLIFINLHWLARVYIPAFLPKSTTLREIPTILVSFHF